MMTCDDLSGGSEFTPFMRSEGVVFDQTLSCFLIAPLEILKPQSRMAVNQLLLQGAIEAGADSVHSGRIGDRSCRRARPR